VKRKTRALLVADIPDWAFARNALDLQHAVKKSIQCDVVYVRELMAGKPWPNVEDYDVILEYFPFPRCNGRLPRNRTIGALLATYLFFEEPYGPPGEVEFRHANGYAHFWVCNLNLFAQYGAHVPNITYLPNPVLMSRHRRAVEDFSELRPCWAGNSKRDRAWDLDPKGFYGMILPATSRLGLEGKWADFTKIRIPPDEMPAWYLDSNVYLCMSRHEGCSNSVNEAMASGQILVSTRCGHVEDLHKSQLKHFGMSGVVLVEPEAEALANALAGLRDLSKADRALMGAVNRAEIQERWSWNVWAEKYTTMLQEVANKWT